MKLLHLVFNGDVVGELEQDRHGALHLIAPPLRGVPRLSLAFAPSTTPVRPRQALAYIEGLLPEGDQVRAATAKRFGVSPRSPFALLSAIGYDCPGAIQFLTTGQLEAEAGGDLVPIADHAIAQRLREIRTNPGAPWIAAGEHWSLGGAQSKLALRLEGGAWHEAHGTQPTTHIIKPGISALASQALTEHVSLRALHHLGLDVAASSFRRFEDEPAIVIERFDRRARDGVLYRLHQEDLCQATSTLPAGKYDVTAEAVAEALRRGGAREAEVLRFVRAVLANWVLGAPDAHAKNYSVLLGSDGLVELAPLYDVATGLGYEDLPEMAMPIGGAQAFARVRRRHLVRFADAMGAAPDIVAGAALQIAQLMPAAFETAIRELDAIAESDRTQLYKTLDALGRHCAHIVTVLESPIEGEGDAQA